jgi:histidyl-tRNA synthetase
VPNEKHHALDEILHIKSFADLPKKYADHPSAKELMKLKELLAENEIGNVVDDLSLMRGFDYYTDIVFEVFDTHPDNNRAMAGGGRYDGLVGLFGVEPLPTVGFALGDVTLQRFLEVHNLLPTLRSETEAIAILIGDVYKDAQPFLMDLRNMGVNLAVDMSGRKLDTSIRHASKSGVPVVMFLGEEEIKAKQVRLKNLDSGEEFSISFDEALAKIEEYQRDQDA